MDLEIAIFSEVSLREKDNIWYHLYVDSKKQMQMNLSTKQKEITDVENKPTVTRRKGEGGKNWETGIDISTLLYTK